MKSITLESANANAHKDFKISLSHMYFLCIIIHIHANAHEDLKISLPHMHFLCVIIYINFYISFLPQNVLFVSQFTIMDSYHPCALCAMIYNSMCISLTSYSICLL